MLIEQPEFIAIDPRWLPEGIEKLAKQDLTASFSAGERNVLKKKRQIPVSEWAEKHRIVPADSSIPGRWKNSTTPYLAAIMDASFFPSVQEIIICAPPQTGKSDCVNNCIGYASDRKPGNVLYVYPDELTAKENAKDRLKPMFQESSRLRTYLTGYMDDMASLKINLRHMKIYMAWANSAARLGNKPLPYGMEKESWCIREGFCMTWDALERILWKDVYLDADGNHYFVRMAFQDALGHRTAEVYDFCRQHRGKIVPTFGKKTMAQPHAWSNIEYYPGTKKPIPGGLKALNINTLYYKNELSRLLEINPADPGAFQYHSELTYNWAAMMNAEYLDEKGFWACPDGKANHGWDCSVLALAAHEVLGVKFWPGHLKNESVKKNTLPGVAKSRFIHGEG